MGPNLVAEPIIVDPLLSDRLEQTEGLAGTRFAEARSRISPEVNSCWQQMAGAYAIYDGPQSPLTQSFRLGLGAEVLSSDLAEIEDFFRSRGAPVFHEVSPLRHQLSSQSSTKEVIAPSSSRLSCVCGSRRGFDDHHEPTVLFR